MYHERSTLFAASAMVLTTADDRYRGQNGG